MAPSAPPLDPLLLSFHSQRGRDLAETPRTDPPPPYGKERSVRILVCYVAVHCDDVMRFFFLSIFRSRKREITFKTVMSISKLIKWNREKQVKKTSKEQEVGRKVDHVPHDAHVCWSDAEVLHCGVMLHHQSERYKSVKSSGTDFIELQPGNKIISLPDCRFERWASTFWYISVI